MKAVRAICVWFESIDSQAALNQTEEIIVKPIAGWCPNSALLSIEPGVYAELSSKEEKIECYDLAGGLCRLRSVITVAAPKSPR